MTYRPEFTPATKRQALEAAGYRCQDPLCGISPEWKELRAEAEVFDVFMGDVVAWRDPNGAELFRQRVLLQAKQFPRGLAPMIKKFRMDFALLEVDHAQECADGGDNDLGNAVVRCVFCHYFKTQVRANSRRRAPKKPTRTFPEQLDVIKTAKVEGLRQLVAAKVGPQTGLYRGEPQPAGRKSEARPRDEVRRHTSERQFQEAVLRREAAIEDNWFGV